MDAVAIPAHVALRSTVHGDSVVTTAVSSLASLERALDRGLREEWNHLAAADPLAGVYQTPGWCVPWYRCYADAYTPYVVLVRHGDALIGVVPMAVERDGGRLVFASDSMADYRDIVARPGARASVVRELIACYVRERFAGPLRIGWLDPASDTAMLAASTAREFGLRCASTVQPCYRWFPEPGENLNKKFSRVRTHLNHFKRAGTVSFDVIDTVDEWKPFFAEFVRQHSLRQLQAARDVSFDDPRKRQLYETVFAERDLHLHATACRVDGRTIAGHIGFVWRGVLMLGAPSISLEDEHRSPAVILAAWIIQNASALGLAGFDLTIGESEFKRRLGNRCVQLTMVEVFGRGRDYFVNQARTRVVGGARRAAERALGDDAWERRIKPAAAAAVYKWERLKELGPRAALVKAASAVVGHAPVEVAYTLTPAAAGALAGAHARFDVRCNAVEDLLLWNGTSPSALASISACARGYGRYRAGGHTLFTVVTADRLAGWCFASAGAIHEVTILPDAPDGALQALLGPAVAAAGSDAVRIVVREDDIEIRRGLGRAGFALAPLES